MGVCCHSTTTMTITAAAATTTAATTSIAAISAPTLCTSAGAVPVAISLIGILADSNGGRCCRGLRLRHTHLCGGGRGQGSCRGLADPVSSAADDNPIGSPSGSLAGNDCG